MPIRTFLCILIFTCLSNQTQGGGTTLDHVVRSVGTTSPNLSHLCVRSFCQDSLGYVWISTARGLNRYNGYEFRHFFHDKTDSLSLDNDMIYSVFLDSRHQLWVGTSTGINRYDFAHDRFLRYKMPSPRYVLSITEDSHGTIWATTTSGIGKIDPQNRCVEMVPDENIRSATVSMLVEDKSGTLWAGTHKGLVCRTGSVWTSVVLDHEKSVTCICPDPQGIFMLGTDSGITLFDPATTSFLETPAILASNPALNKAYIHFIREIRPLKYLIGTSSNGIFLYDALRQTLQQDPPEYTEPLHSREPLCCYVDRQDNVWIGTFDNSFAVINPQHNFFNLDHEIDRTFKNVYSTRIIEDEHRNLWVGTRYRGLWFYSKDRTVRRYDISNSPIFKTNNLVEELFIDSRHRLWIAGAEQLAVGTYDSNGKITVLHTIPHRGIGSATITEDRAGNIWFGLASGLFLLRNGSLSGKLEKIYSGNISKVYLLSDGRLLFSAFGNGVYSVDSQTMSVSPVKMPSPETSAISRHCVDIFEDSQQRIWFGSYNEGVMYVKGSECRTLSIADGLSCNDITCIQQDRLGDIWLSTAYGISRIDRDMAITNYFENDGTRGNLFHEKASLLRRDSTLFFTGNHGLTFFDPQVLTRNDRRSPVVIEDLKIKNESVVPAEKGSILKNTVSYTDQITLSHKHSVITIDYSGIDFLSPRKLTYAYKLEGFDEKWNFVGEYRRASYSNFTPGEYVFQVKAINGDGLESAVPATLRIIVKPAPWATWWAWSIYILLLTTAILFFTNLRIKIRLQQERLELEANERKREQDVNKMKMTFYTNISHELRTPLTLISAPTQQLMRLVDPESPAGKLLATIHRNCSQLHRLMDQLLDFRKMEDGMLSLKVVHADIAAELETIIKSYRIIAAEKNISVLFSPKVRPLNIWYDPDKIEKIMHNLLSNAMKHTPENGRIEIIAEECSIPEVHERYGIESPQERYLEISVSDNGPGVPEDKLSELFVRYRQIESPAGLRSDYTGSGIGLHYTLRLVEMHRGKIIAKLRKPTGMRFSFILPSGDVYRPEEKAEAGIPESDTESLIPANADRTPEQQDAKKHEYTILVAEDNTELMIYFRQMLGEEYNVIEATNGTQAWEILQNESPDLILSDVVMPGLSGYELCARVKQHPDLSHIPVILLTAKTSMPEQIEGLTHGADAYVCKPFNVEYLLLLIGNQFRNRSMLRSYYFSSRSKTDREEPPVKLNAFDRKFMDKLMKLLEKSLSDTELNIDEIASEMAFSRTSFYRKLKGLTNMAPADFIRAYRLRRAAEMIEEGSWNLYEVAENVGFSNYTHFSVIFKKHFGVSPKDYRTREHHE